MSRSLYLERIRINIEICCETIGDFLASSLGGLKRPLMMLVGLALVMTLRSARKGVQRMKLGGLTAGGHEATYKAHNANSAFGSRTSTMTTASTGLKGSLYLPSTSTSTNANPGAYGTASTGTGVYGSTSGSTYGGSFGGASGSTYGGATGTAFGSTGATGYNNPSASTYGTSSYGSSTSVGAYGNSNNGITSGGSLISGSMTSDQPPRSLSDLIDRHGASVRVMDSRQFHDYGGVHEFYGQVETLQAYEGAGVVEKVLQGPGYNKVLVVDGGGNLNVAIFNKNAATSARQNGWKGVIIHGAIRDAKEVGGTAIGCKAMGTNPNKGRATTGSKGSALNIAGMPITTGTWVYADKDGIAFSDMELTTGGVSGIGLPGSNGVGTTMGASGAFSQYQSGGTASGYGGQVSNEYGSQSFGGSMGTSGNAFSTQSGGGSSGYATPGGYGSSAGAGTYGSQTGSTFGAAVLPYGSSAKGASGSYLNSHAKARASSGAHEDASVSVAVYLSLISLMIVPFGLV